MSKEEDRGDLPPRTFSPTPDAMRRPDLHVLTSFVAPFMVAGGALQPKVATSMGPTNSQPRGTACSRLLRSGEWPNSGSQCGAAMRSR